MARWQWLRETMALVFAQAAGMLAVAVALVSVVYSALEPLITRCGPRCASAHAQLVLYLLAAAAAVSLLAFAAVALARRPSPVEELRRLARRLFEECDRCREAPDCGYMLWFGDESIVLDIADDEVERIARVKCEPLLPRRAEGEER